MLLTEEQTLIRDTARAFAQEQVVPHVRAWEAAGEIPRALLTEMGQLGFMGMTVPAEWGGADADMVSYVLALEEIAAADGGLSTVMSVNNSPDCAALLAYGSPEQKEKLAEAAGARRDAGRLLPHRAAGGLRRLEPQDPRRAARQRLGAERREAVHHLGPHRRHGAGLRRHRSRARPSAASPASSCRPRRPATVSPRSRRNWARNRPTPARSPSRTAPSAPTPCSARRARATAWRWPTWRSVASASPPRPSAWRAPPSRPRAPMPASARRSAPRSSTTRPCNSAWPTWRPR